MHFSTILASLGVMASATLASGAQNVVYWGQNGGGTIENNDLSSYCSSTSGIDILVLAFLYEYGNGNSIASGTIGQSCYITPAGVGQECDAIAAAIDTCKANGVKIILSLGGAVGAYSLQSQSEAETIGQNLWEAYGNLNGADTNTPRPFGDTFVNGWDFDIESNDGNQYYQYMISTLRSNFASDPSNTYYITGAPQCPIPEPNMEVIITNAKFDYLWVQFYNNPGCSVNGVINYDAWKTNLAGTPSANAELFIGVPASPLGATGTENGAQYYLTPSELASLVAEYDTDSAFGGIMMWSAGFSDSLVYNGCTYAQEAKNILLTGSPCSGAGSDITTSTTSTTSSTSSTTTGTATTMTTITLAPSSATFIVMGVAQWHQVSTPWETSLFLLGIFLFPEPCFSIILLTRTSHLT
jgi:chitinase